MTHRSLMMRPAASKFFVASLCLPSLLATGCYAQTPSAGANAGIEIIKMDRPFLFSYGTWDKKAKIDGGVAALDAEGMTPAGGAGVNVPLDLTAHANDCPEVRVSVGPRNTLKTLKLMLGDAAGHQGAWFFSLPATGSGFVTLAPASGAALSHPDSAEKGIPAIGKIIQWQLLGDWAGSGPVDVKVNAVLAAPPDAAAQKQRQAQAGADAAALAKTQADKAADRAKYGTVSALSPVVQTVYAAGPNLLALVIHSGTITPSHLTDYAPQPGDTSKFHDNGLFLSRGGQEVVVDLANRVWSCF